MYSLGLLEKHGVVPLDTYPQSRMIGVGEDEGRLKSPCIADGMSH